METKVKKPDLIFSDKYTYRGLLTEDDVTNIVNLIYNLNQAVFKNTKLQDKVYTLCISTSGNNLVGYLLMGNLTPQKDILGLDVLYPVFYINYNIDLTEKNYKKDIRALIKGEFIGYKFLKARNVVKNEDIEPKKLETAKVKRDDGKFKQSLNEAPKRSLDDIEAKKVLNESNESTVGGKVKSIFTSIFSRNKVNEDRNKNLVDDLLSNSLFDDIEVKLDFTGLSILGLMPYVIKAESILGTAVGYKIEEGYDDRDGSKGGFSKQNDFLTKRNNNYWLNLKRFMEYKPESKTYIDGNNLFLTLRSPNLNEGHAIYLMDVGQNSTINAIKELEHVQKFYIKILNKDFGHELRWHLELLNSYNSGNDVDINSVKYVNKSKLKKAFYRTIEILRYY